MRIIFYCLLLTAIVSCHKPSAAINKKKLEQLADRSCRAISIRQQRFALADRIRFAQDTLTRIKSKNDSERLQNRLKIYMGQKDTLLKASLALADTIRLQLDSLMPYTDKQAQKRFNASLDSLLQKKGCADKSQKGPSR